MGSAVCTCLLKELPDDSYFLAFPIEVELEYDGGEVIASIPEIYTYGSGNTKREALIDLGFELIDFADILYEEPVNKLGKRMLKCKKFIDRVLRK